MAKNYQKIEKLGSHHRKPGTYNVFKYRFKNRSAVLINIAIKTVKTILSILEYYPTDVGFSGKKIGKNSKKRSNTFPEE